MESRPAETGILGAISIAARWCACVMLIASVALNFANVIGRYLLDAPISWAEEVMIFLMIGLVLFGAVAVTAQGTHIRMDLLVSFLPAPAQRALDAFSALLLAAIGATMVAVSTGVVWFLWRLDQRSIAGEFLMAVPHSAMVIGFGLMAVAALLRLFQAKTVESVHPPPDTHETPAPGRSE